MSILLICAAERYRYCGTPGAKCTYLARRLPLSFRSGLGWTFSRSSGPGGQNVNKRNTKALLRVDPSVLPAVLLPGSGITPNIHGQRKRDGTLVFTSQKHRTQAENRRACLQKLADVIDAANSASMPLPVPSEAQKQRAKARIAMATEERLREKRYRSNKKMSRRIGRTEEW
ncbi:hypothetical protein PMAC_000186 [Pneumocystis sp. 'macacae']|nr:hypothetical protein PMAC_000186 [Pneumocystis sp. 'macacae']